MGGTVALGLAGAVLVLTQAWLLSGLIVDAIASGTNAEWWRGALVLAAVLVARAALDWAAQAFAQRAAIAARSELRLGLMRAILTAPQVTTEHSARVALAATRGLEGLDAWFGRVLPQSILAIVVPVLVVLALVFVDPLAALTIALTVPLVPLFMVLVGRLSASQRRRRWRTLNLLGHRFLDVVTGLPTLRVFNRAEAQVGLLRQATDEWRKATLATLRVAFLSALVLELLASLSVALVAVGVGLRLDAGTMAFHAGLFAILVAPEAYLPLRRLGADYHASEEGLAATADIERMSAPAPASVRLGRTPPPSAIAGLTISDVCVRRAGRDEATPADASFSVDSGELVALVGATGVGKSSLLAAILGLLEPAQGRVEVRGAHGMVFDVRELDQDAWHSRIGWLPQHPFMAAGSLADAVRLGTPGATDEELEIALALVGLAGVPLDRPVGEHGTGWSAGERRRIGLARVLARRAQLLLLDEPTAGLDRASEERVMRTLRAAADDGAVVLMVSHRPGAIELVDRTVRIGKQ